MIIIILMNFFLTKLNILSVIVDGHEFVKKIIVK